MVSRYGDLRPYEVIGDLDLLHGPAAGVVELPSRLAWSPVRTRVLDRDDTLAWFLSEVVQEAKSEQDLIDFVDGDSLIRLWPQIALPARCREMWEAHHPVLARRRAPVEA